MATRWSRAHGESYLRRKWSGGGVEDVERLTMVLWFRGIGQWRSVLGGIGSAVLRRSGRLRAEEGEEMQNGTATRRAGTGASRRGCPRQGIHGAWPARLGERRRVAPRGVIFLNRSATFTEHFLKNAIQRSMVMTDSTYSTRQPG